MGTCAVVVTGGWGGGEWGKVETGGGILVVGERETIFVKHGNHGLVKGDAITSITEFPHGEKVAVGDSGEKVGAPGQGWKMSVLCERHGRGLHGIIGWGANGVYRRGVICLVD